MGCKAVVIRHPEKEFYKQLTNVHIPIINAGDGTGDHPTQSLVDLLTVQQHFRRFQNINIVICGDIRHSRIARTNAKVLRRLGANVFFAGPEEWLDKELTEGKIISMDEAVHFADVLMLLRAQTERHKGMKAWSKEEYHQQYGLTIDREKLMKNRSIIMHPGPVNRDVEIASELVECERSRILQQIKNGVLVRKAVLAKLLHLVEDKEFKHVI